MRVVESLEKDGYQHAWTEPPPGERRTGRADVARSRGAELQGEPTPVLRPLARRGPGLSRAPIGPSGRLARDSAPRRGHRAERSMARKRSVQRAVGRAAQP